MLKVRITNIAIILLTLILIGYVCIPTAHASSDLIESAENPMFEELVNSNNGTSVYSIHLATSLICEDEDDSSVYDDSYVYVDFNKGIYTAANITDSKYFDADTLASLPITSCKNQIDYVNNLLTSYTDVASLDDFSLSLEDMTLGMTSYISDCHLYNLPNNIDQVETNDSVRVYLARVSDLVYIDSITFSRSYIHNGKGYSINKVFEFEPLNPESDITTVDPLYSGCLCEDMNIECECVGDCDDADGCESHNFLGEVKTYEKKSS